MGGSANPSPQVPWQMMPMMNYMQSVQRMGLNAASQAQGQINPYDLGFTSQAGQQALGGLQGFENTMFGAGGQQAAQNLFNIGSSQLGNAAATGFAPESLTNLANLMRPGMVDIPYEQQVAQNYEEGARAGNARGTGMVQANQATRRDLEANFGSQFAPIAGGITQNAQNIMANAASSAMNAPGLLSQSALGRLQGITNLGQTRENMAFQGAGGAASLLQGMPMFQPTSSGGKGESMGQIMQVAGPIIMAAAMCHIAAAVYGGWSKPEVHAARQWLATQAPRWFFLWYQRNAPIVARWIPEDIGLYRSWRGFWDGVLEGREPDYPSMVEG